MTSYRDRIVTYVKETWQVPEEHLWRRFPDYVIFRHEDNQKWFGLIMDVPGTKLGLAGEETVDILNVKLGDPILRDMLIRQEGFLKGYHISRGNWISILLDGTVDFAEICRWLEESYMVGRPKNGSFPPIPNIMMWKRLLPGRTKSTGNREKALKQAIPFSCTWQRPYRQSCISVW